MNNFVLLTIPRPSLSAGARSSALAIVALVALASSAQAFSTGPPNLRTNAPGELNCTISCHVSFPLNSGTGAISFSGLENGYTPGQAHTLTITLADPDAIRWGFEMTVLDGANQFIGDLRTLNSLTQTSTDAGTGREYIKHTSSGTAFGTSGSNSWQVRWDAPVSGSGDVTFYIASNGANGNFSNLGDRIYATSFTVSEQTATSAPRLARADFGLQNTPNPFNPRTVISFELAEAQLVEVSVFNLRGEKVRTLASGLRPAGLNELAWNGNDRAGNALASGIYLYRIVTPTGTESRSMTLLK